MSRSIEREAVFSVTPERLWRALTTTAELNAWMGPGASIDPRVGGRLVIGAPGGADIVEIDPPRRMVIQWDMFASTQPIIGTFILEPTPGGTRLTIVEEGYGEGVSETWAIAGSHAGWISWLENMQRWVSEGKGGEFFDSGIPQASFSMENAEGLGSGIFVRSVKEGGAADLAGLREGDILRQWNSETMETASDFWRLLWAARPGEQVNLQIERDGRTEAVAITLAAQ